MSPAAAATTTQSQNPNPIFQHNQNTDSNRSVDCGNLNFADAGTEGLSFNFSCSFPPKADYEKANYVRRKPRLVKMRKRSSKESDSKVLDSDFNPFASVTESSKIRDFEATCVSSASNSTLNGDNNISETLKFKSSESNFDFAFGVNKSKSSSNTNAETLGVVFGNSKNSCTLNTNLETGSFVFGADKSNSRLNSSKETGGSVFETTSSCSMSKLNSANMGFLFGDNKSSSRMESGGFVFVADKSRSRLNLDMENAGFGFGAKEGGSVSNSSLGNGGFAFGGDKSGLTSDESNLRDDVQGECADESQADESGKSNNRSSSCVGSNRETVGSGKSATGSGSTGFGAFDDSCFVFSAGKGKLGSENEQSGENLDKQNSETFDPVLGDKQCSDANYSGDKFANQSHSAKGVDSHSSVNRTSGDAQEIPLFKLSDDLKRWSINDSEKTDRGNKLEDAVNNIFLKVDAKFVIGSNQKTSGSLIEKAGVYIRSPRDKRSKRSKGKLRREVLAKQLTGKGHDRKGNFHNNDDSSGCDSPMDFSPYQTSDAAPFSGASQQEETTGGERYDMKGGAKTSEEFHSSISDNNSQRQSIGEKNHIFSIASSAQDGLSSLRHQYRKKYKLKVGRTSHQTTQNRKSTLNSQSKGKILSKASEDHDKSGPAQLMTDEACETWRIRGNQAYKAGHLSKAEELYTMGVQSVAGSNVSELCIQPLLLCYSNRAATRMSLGRIREALSDCKMASALDPSFLKVKLRAANCHLVLGEVEDAIAYYNNCLESESHVCLDRRIAVEAADGLLKARKVADCIRQSVEILQQRSSGAATRALDIIAEAMKISCYSERLFEIKGETLCMLSMYKEVIQLCEQTLHIAESNFITHHNHEEGQNSYPRMWRWCLMSKSHYHLGKLELALDLIDKQEQIISTVNESQSVTWESTISLAVTIRQLLHHKKAGNEAFKSGRHGEAVEHYTAAISKSIESRPFAAICFCNRAAAYQAMGQIVDAIADCSLAIALDSNYLKALSRRATLHEMIRDYEQAANDLQKIVSLLEDQCQEGSQQSDTHNRSSGSSVKDLQKTRNRLLSFEKKIKKGISLDLYQILGVKASDTELEIKKAYRKSALRHHPDKAAQLLSRSDIGDDQLWKDIVEKVNKDADRLFKMIGEAYGVLSDPEKRLKYNDEEELRDVLRNNNKSSHSGRGSEFYSSPFERGNWSGRQSDFHSSPFFRGGSRRYWQDESSRRYSNSSSRW